MRHFLRVSAVTLFLMILLLGIVSNIYLAIAEGDTSSTLIPFLSGRVGHIASAPAFTVAFFGWMYLWRRIRRRGS